MANKRLILMLEDCEQDNEPLVKYDRNNVESSGPYSAKRHKANGKSNLESPLQRMLHRQVSGNTSILSPITELSHNMRDTLLNVGGTPKSSTLRSYNSVSSSYDSSNSLDDEYMAMFELEAIEQVPLSKLPGDLDALISGQLKTNDDEPAERKRSARRCLSMSQQESLGNLAAPVHNGIRSLAKEQASTTPIRKTLSMNDADILSALGDGPELIGDLSKPCALPVLHTGVRHGDLKTISCDTLARLMRGEFANLMGCYTIIDCRYPYEFDGGHIQGALNLYTRAQVKDAFPKLVSSTEQADNVKRRIYVFHCEFSSERGPKLMRFLRSNDRSMHTHNYPSLDYPELYLLNNGYKEFFSSYGMLCEPCSYVPMLAPAHNEEYRFFRAKTKSWQCGDSDGGGDSGFGGTTDGSSCPSSRSRTLRKSRSRVLYAE